jgi:hypothetical protein
MALPFPKTPIGSALYSLPLAGDDAFHAPVRGMADVFWPDTVITFKGQASDPEDGEISEDDDFRWFSSRDGFLGNGKTFQTSDLYFYPEWTTHTITLEVTDSNGNTGNHAINVSIFELQ